MSKKTGRPISNTVDYFPHKCKDSKELVIYSTQVRIGGI